MGSSLAHDKGREEWEKSGVLMNHAGSRIGTENKMRISLLTGERNKQGSRSGREDQGKRERGRREGEGRGGG